MRRRSALRAAVREWTGTLAGLIRKGEADAGPFAAAVRAHVGDTVLIEESRPLSATKRWRLVSVLSRAGEERAGVMIPAEEAETTEAIHAAAHPGDPDGPLAQMVVVDSLGHQAVDGAVMASRAEMEGNIPQRRGSFENLLHG